LIFATYFPFFSSATIMDSISSADADILLNRRANAQRSAATRSSSGSAVRTPRALQGAVQDLTGGERETSLLGDKVRAMIVPLFLR
jgi:hypothetical protein